MGTTRYTVAISPGTVDRVDSRFHLKPPPAIGGLRIGYALAPDDAEQTLHLIQRADEAMYLAKNQGRNRAAHCDEAG